MHDLIGSRIALPMVVGSRPYLGNRTVDALSSSTLEEQQFVVKPSAY